MKLVVAAVLLLAVVHINKAVVEVCILDVAFVVDHSGSIRDHQQNGQDNWGQVINFIKEVVKRLKISASGTHMAVVSYGNDAKLDFDLDDHLNENEMLDAVNRIRYRGGNTNTTGGLRLMRTKVFSAAGGDRTYVPDLCILITDGVPTREEGGLMAEINTIKNKDISIITVGVTERVKTTLLKKIVTSEEYYFSVEDFDRLDSILNRLISQACVTLVPPAPTLAEPAPCNSRSDVVFVMDSSGSIEQRYFNKIKAFVSSIVMELDLENDKTRVGSVTFAGTTNLNFHLNAYRSRTDARAAIENVPYLRGRTNTAAALSYMYNNMFQTGRGDRADVPNIVIVLTDGASNSPRDTQREAFKLKQKGVHVIIIGIGGWTDKLELNNMASASPRNNIIYVNNYNSLPSIRRRIIDMICDNRDECRSNPCRNSGQCINGIEMFWCRCSSGYGGERCDRRSRVKADVAIALDASGSVGKANFLKQIGFVYNVANGLNVNSDSKVAAMTYANSPNVQFHLNSNAMKYGVLNSLNFHYTGGSTNIAGAIDAMRNDIFTSGRGDRGDIHNVGLIITDGSSDNKAATMRAAINARKQGMTLLVIGVGPNVCPSELTAIASYPQDRNYYKTQSFDTIGGLANNLILAVTNADDECLSNPCQNNGKCVDIINGYRCECGSDHWGNRCERRGSGKADIVFAVDASGSIRRERFYKILDFVNTIIEQYSVIDGKTRFGALVFSDSASVAFHLNAYNRKQDVMAAVSQIKFAGGRTHTAAALQLMKDSMFTRGNGARDGTQKILIIITDGNSNVNVQNTIPYAINARVKGIHMIVVSIGNLVNMLELRGMTSMPVAKNLFEVKSWSNLPNARTPLLRSMFDGVNDCNSNPCRNRGICKDLMNRYWCECKDDYTGVNCNRQCGKQMDLVFILDLSGSLQNLYDISLNFMSIVIHGLSMRSGNARIALISYSNSARVEFYLNTYTNKQEVLNALSFRVASGSRTNTQDAISRAYNNVFSSGRGDRGGVKNVAVVITDGHSNVNAKKTAEAAKTARQKKIEVFVAATTYQANMDEVHDIATDPDNSHVVNLRSKEDAAPAASQLLNQLCR